MKQRPEELIGAEMRFLPVYALTTGCAVGDFLITVLMIAVFK